jgi:hypothetical protein
MRRGFFDSGDAHTFPSLPLSSRPDGPRKRVSGREKCVCDGKEKLPYAGSGAPSYTAMCRSSALA